MQEKQFYVYILAKEKGGTFYTGFAADLPARISAHKQEQAEGFTKKYGIKNLVYHEVHNDRDAALHREKQLKKWHRTWKIRLIEGINPYWEDLYEKICR